MLLFVEIGCNSPPTAPAASQPDYVILQDGLVKQYYDSTGKYYEYNKIYGTTTREDGQVVFIEKSSSSSPNSNYIFTVCYFIRDGYYYSSSPVKSGNAANPYGDTRVGKVHPKEGYSWIPRADIHDSIQIKYTAHYVGDMVTPAGEFHNVYDFRYYDVYQNKMVHTYYAENIGHIATIEGTRKLLLNYARIGDKEYGAKQ